VVLDLTEARDRDLVRRVGRGEEEAFRELFGRYAASANALARRIVVQPFLAEEIVQEAFLAIWRDPDAYDERRGSVRAWLMGMVHHRAVDAVRREESQRRRAEDARAADALEEAPDVADAVAEVVDAPRERRAIRAALEDLPDEQREVLELMYFRGLTQSAIATEMRIPLGTVKSRSLLGMRRLRDALERISR
jgi:RNA polymerase sigma factor (sigma-70 family)